MNRSLLLVLACSGLACGPSNTLYLDDATAVRLADDRITTTVSVACDGDCRTKGPFCVVVTWTFGGTSDTSQTCSADLPADGATTPIVVTSNGAVPATLPDGGSVDVTTGVVTLTDTNGMRLPNGESPLGAGFPTSFGVTVPQ